MARIRKNIFEEFERVKSLVKEELPEFDVRELCVVLGRLGGYHYNKKAKMVLGVEKKLYNLLIENSYNPYTVYRWALLERVPDEIKFQLRNHYLSQKKASQQWFKQRHETELSLHKEIRMLGLRIIRGM